MRSSRLQNLSGDNISLLLVLGEGEGRVHVGLRDLAHLRGQGPPLHLRHASRVPRFYLRHAGLVLLGHTRRSGLVFLFRCEQRCCGRRPGRLRLSNRDFTRCAPPSRSKAMCVAWPRYFCCSFPCRRKQVVERSQNCQRRVSPKWFTRPVPRQCC